MNFGTSLNANVTLELFDSNNTLLESQTLVGTFQGPFPEGFIGLEANEPVAVARITSHSIPTGASFNFDIDDLRFEGPVQVVPDPMSLDVKPGEFPNRINLRSNGVLPVAVLTTPDSDATTIDTSDLSAIRFGDVDLMGRVFPLRAALDDVDGDGDLDLILHFSMRQIREAGALTADSTAAELTGFTAAGTPWWGADSVEIVPHGGAGLDDPGLEDLVTALLGGPERRSP